MPENNNPNFDNQSQDNPNEERAVGAAAGAVPSQTEPQELKAQRGGEQTDQIVGETARGAHNQPRENRNPSGNDPDMNAQENENF